jgi:hypothetical protein
MRYIFTLVLLTTLGLGQLRGQILISLLFGDKLNKDYMEFGLEGGFNANRITGFNNYEFNRNFNLGFYFDIRIKEHWFIYTSVLVKANNGTYGLDTADVKTLNGTLWSAGGSYSQVINNFQVPIMLKYRHPSRFYVEGGAQLALATRSYVAFSGSVGSTEAEIREKNTDDINRIEAGVVAGAGYKFLPVGGLTLGVRYYQGLTEIYRGKEGFTSSGWYLKANFPIGLNKKIKAEPQP